MSDAAPVARMIAMGMCWALSQPPAIAAPPVPSVAPSVSSLACFSPFHAC